MPKYGADVAHVFEHKLCAVYMYSFELLPVLCPHNKSQSDEKDASCAQHMLDVDEMGRHFQQARHPALYSVFWSLSIADIYNPGKQCDLTITRKEAQDVSLVADDYRTS